MLKKYFLDLQKPKIGPEYLESFPAPHLEKQFLFLGVRVSLFVFVRFLRRGVGGWGLGGLLLASWGDVFRFHSVQLS